MISARPLLLALPLLAFATQADARDRLRIVGSEASLKYTQPVAEQFARHWSQPTPSLEVTGAGVGYQLFCAGVSYQHPDIATAARPMTEAERSVCKDNGVTDITEVEFGRDAIVLVHAGDKSRIDITKGQLFAALASEVPGPEGLVQNASRHWSDIDASLPKTPILVMAPKPNTSAAIAFQENILAEGCKTFPAILELKEAQRERVCRSLRKDGHVVNANKLEEQVISWLEENTDAYAAINFTTFRHFEGRTALNAIEGVAPSDATIRDGRYPLTTGLYIYLKDQHVKGVPNLQQFLYELTSERALGPDGYLADRDLVSLDDIGRNRARDEALKFGI